MKKIGDAHPEHKEFLDVYVSHVEAFLDMINRDVEAEIDARNFFKAKQDLDFIIKYAGVMKLDDVVEAAKKLRSDVVETEKSRKREYSTGLDRMFKSLKIGEVKEKDGFYYVKGFGESGDEGLAKGKGQLDAGTRFNKHFGESGSLHGGAIAMWDMITRMVKLSAQC